MSGRNSKKIIIITAAAIIVAAAVTAILAFSIHSVLVLEDAESGKEYAVFPVSDGDGFSVEFIHSVNKSPVRDIYEIRNGNEIFVVETDYFGFGAGVQTQLNPGEILEYGDDGSMQIKNIDKRLPDLIYIVGTVSDHVLRIAQKEISLRELCGKNSHVRFAVKKRLF